MSIVMPEDTHKHPETASRRRSFSMLGWALNEEDNIAGYISKAEDFLRSMTSDFELILIDDGSRDATHDIIVEHQKTRPWLRLVRNEENKGAGYNAKLAITLATKDYLFWQPVDWCYDISKLPELLDLLDDYDVLQGVRPDTVSLGGLFTSRSDNPYKGLVSIMNYLWVRTFFQLPFHDYQNVTVYPTQLIQSVKLESESSFINPECLLKTWWKGTTYKEFPVPFLKRQKGESAGTKPKQIFIAIRDITFFWFRWIVLGQRPDKLKGTVTYWDGRIGGRIPTRSRSSMVS